MLPHKDQFSGYKIKVAFGTEKKRRVVAGIAGFYQPDQLIGKKIPVLVNLEPRTMRGTDSHGMILAVVQSTNSTMTSLISQSVSSFSVISSLIAGAN